VTSDADVAYLGGPSEILFTYGDGPAENGADGWYRDPFAVHDERLFIHGMATPEVRDGGVWSYDEPPEYHPH
jgi:hypothetical protein